VLDGYTELLIQLDQPQKAAEVLLLTLVNPQVGGPQP